MAKYNLELFIAGKTAVSVEAIRVITAICKEELKGKYHLTIIDILEEPDKAEEEKLMAIPTLIRRLPQPEVRLIGALSFKSRVLAGLGLVYE